MANTHVFWFRASESERARARAQPQSERVVEETEGGQQAAESPTARLQGERPAPYS